MSRFKIGDEVYSIPDPTRNGAYADYIVVRESELALKPNSLHHIRAAAVPLAALTAWQSLFDTAQLQPGQRVLIHAGSGGVGHFAVQLAKWKGAYVFATASTKNQDLLRELGVDKADRLHATAIRRHRAQNRHCARHHRRRNAGTLLVSFEKGRRSRFVGPAAVGGESQRTRRPRRICGGHPNGAQLAEIAKIIDSGKLAPVIDRILPLSEVRRAHELSQSGHTHGKIVLRVSNGDGTLERKQS